MNKNMRNGRSSELVVCSKLILLGLDIYVPLVDDQGIDFIICIKTNRHIKCYPVQVKSVENHNSIVGVKKNKIAVLIIHYRNTNNKDEFYYFTNEQIDLFYKDTKWNDFSLNNKGRYDFKHQTLEDLSHKILNDEL